MHLNLGDLLSVLTSEQLIRVSWSNFLISELASEIPRPFPTKSPQWKNAA
jgi:hypothetical protein